MKDLSIIIVTYNSENFIETCLKSVFETIFDLDFEVIVIDNNSQDKTVSKIQEDFPQVSLIKNKENLGFAKAVNQGIRESQGEYILLLNPDTEVLPKSLNKMYSFLKKRREAGIVGCQLKDKRSHTQASFGHFPNLNTEFFHSTGLYKFLPWGRITANNIFTWHRFKKVHKVDWVGGACQLIKRKVIEKVGLLDKNYFLYLEDIDFCFRARKAGFEVYYYPKVFIWHYLQQSVKDPAKAILVETKSLIYFFEKHYGKRCLVPLIRLIRLRAYLQIFRWSLVSLLKPEKKIFVKAYKKVLTQLK